MELLAFIRFETPGYLALLAVIPLLIALSFRSLGGLGPVRRVFAICARCVVVVLIVLALAGAERTKSIDDLSVIFLVDRSKSIPPDLQRQGLEYLKKTGEQRRLDDRIGVIAFDGVADVEQLPMKAMAVDHLSTPADADRTNLAAAARMALALLPADTAKRIVVITDGNENVGDILEEAERLSAAGIPIDVLPVQYTHANEVVFESLKSPPTATAEETINLQMVLRAQQAASGKILLWHNDVLVDLNGAAAGTGYPVNLSPGPNRFVIPVPLRVAGAHRFKTQFVPDQAGADTIEDNNTGEAFTVVSGQGKILLLTTTQDLASEQPSAEILRRALEADKLVCDVEVAGQNPLDQVRLLEYSLVVLSNVPAGDLRDEEKKSLAVYVRDLGGGLVMVGGDDSFGAGGWLGSEVEEVMPVSFDVKHKKQFLKGALTLVMHACEVPQGNYLGVRCAVEAVKTLSSRDLVGVLAWQWLGDKQGHWVVPLQEVGSRTPIINAINKMSMGDMPDLDEVMRPAVEALIARKDVGPKHMIVVSDFDPAPPAADLIAAMKANGITCSTVAIGYGGHMIDEPKAREIATATKGRFYRTDDYSKLPQIFVKESREIRRSLVQETPFTPRLVNPVSPVVPGLTGEGLPALGGFVLTTPKPLADIPIIHKSEEGDDPVVAHWQVGLGKTVAFTSGLWSRWGTNWVKWPKFSKFWGQVARWASRQSEAAAFDVTTTVHGGKAKVRIDALDKNADAINFMEVGGNLVNPGQESRKLQLTQTGPGRYEAEFDARERGNYIVNLAYRTGQGKQAISGNLRTGLSIAYSPEYSQLRANLPLLEEIRTRTHGRMLDAADTGAPFDRAGLPRAEARAAIWENLVRWMLALFLLDVAIRRIAISPLELYRKARRFLAEIAGRGRPAGEVAEVLSTLKGARDRVREEQRLTRTAEGEPGQPAATARYEAPMVDAKASEDLSRALGGATQQDVPIVARPTGKKPVQSEGDYTSRLLRAKRRAREDMDKKDE
jgi:uncharacterized membrane protein/Mg-chelatase subunit ChlD